MSAIDFNDAADAPCAACDDIVCSSDDALECDICENWFHLSCADASQSLYNMYDHCDGLPWFCKSCKASIRDSFSVVRQLTSENLALREQVSELIKVVEELKSESSPLNPPAVESQSELQHDMEISSTPSLSLSMQIPPAESDNHLPASSPSHLSSPGRSRSESMPPLQHRLSNKSNDYSPKRSEIRYLRKVDKDCSISSITFTLSKAKINFKDCLIEQTVPQEEFRGIFKFVRITFDDQVAVNAFEGLKSLSTKWKLLRKQPVPLAQPKKGCLLPKSSYRGGGGVLGQPDLQSFGINPALSFLGSNPWQQGTNQFLLPPFIPPHLMHMFAHPPPPWYRPPPPPAMPPPPPVRHD